MINILIKFYSFWKSVLAKLVFLFLLLVSARATCQTNLKNALPELMSRFNGASTQTAKSGLAISIGNFYFTNKMHTKAMSDSIWKYASIAESLISKDPYKAGYEDLKLLQLKYFLRNKKIAEAKKMAAESTGRLYGRLNYVMGDYYLSKPGDEVEDIEMAGQYFLATKNYADKKGMPNVSLLNQIGLYNVMIYQGINDSLCTKYLYEVIGRCRAYKSKNIEVKAYVAKAVNDINHYNLPGFMVKAASVAHAAGAKEDEIFCLKEIADYNLRQGKIDSAEQQLKRVLRMYQALGYKNLQFTYDLMAATALVKGNMEQGMKYSLAAAKTAEETGTDNAINGFYSRIARLCRDLGLKDQSLAWYRKWQQAAMRTETTFPYAAYSAIANELIAKGKARQVLKTLDSADRVFKYDASGVFLIPQLRAESYAALGMSDSAEYFNYKIIKNLENRGMKDYLYYQAYQNLAAFFVKEKRFKQAAPFVDIVMAANKGTVKAADMAALEMYKFKIDSANGSFISAINHFKMSKAITDSIYNQARIKQSEQLQLQYATAERDHENLVLRNRNNLQKSELEKEGLNRKLVSIALLASVLVTALLFYLYRAKQKSNFALSQRQLEINERNRELQLRQEEINAQNEQLQSSQVEINEQNKWLNQLLNEKEWLIKEIHHRVKNNLQIISSLLNTQSSYLNNEEALTAIRDSQNRMQAISIVHQKLYQSEDMSTINLSVYIDELAQSIRDSFNADHQIRFVTDIRNVQLTTAQVVPLGLILNEAITNSVKYAFNEGESGIISLTSSILPDNLFELIISDNGKGLPEGFDINTCTSLGLNLMAGLVSQLAGNFHVWSDEGTNISVCFPLYE